MKVRAVLFDAVGTLIYARPGVAEVYYQVDGRFGCRLTAAQIDERFREALRQERERARQSRRTSGASVSAGVRLWKSPPWT